MQQALHRSSLVPRGFLVESACYEGDKAVITVRASGTDGLCPSCGTVSRRIHSRYRRRVTDLPLSGRIVQLRVIARRFRCDAVLCGRQIFTERFEGVLAPSARRTARLDSIVHHLGLALGGRPAAGFAKRLHGVDENEEVVVRRQFRRAEMIRYFERIPPVLVAIESCGSSHHWGRLLQSFGHEVKLISPQYVKAYVKRGKNDAADAEALCESVTRPSMRFVPVKSKEQQAACMLMTVRERLVTVKYQLSNAFRSYAAEFGIVGPAGRQNVAALIKRVLEDDSLPEMARDLFRFQADEYAG